jgi:hypothetical protein
MVGMRRWAIFAQSFHCTAIDRASRDPKSTRLRNATHCASDGREDGPAEANRAPRLGTRGLSMGGSNEAEDPRACFNCRRHGVSQTDEDTFLQSVRDRNSNRQRNPASTCRALRRPGSCRRCQPASSLPQMDPSADPTGIAAVGLAGRPKVLLEGRSDGHGSGAVLQHGKQIATENSKLQQSAHNPQSENNSGSPARPAQADRKCQVEPRHASPNKLQFTVLRK